MEHPFKVGDTVYVFYKGETQGTVSNITVNEEIQVKFEGYEYNYYYGGKNDIKILSFTPYNLKDGGWSWERPWEPEIPEVGEWAFFWDDNYKNAVWDILTEIDSTYEHSYATKDNEYHFCSKTPPPHMRNKED